MISSRLGLRPRHANRYVQAFELWEYMAESGVEIREHSGEFRLCFPRFLSRTVVDEVIEQARELKAELLELYHCSPTPFVPGSTPLSVVVQFQLDLSRECAVNLPEGELKGKLLDLHAQGCQYSS